MLTSVTISFHGLITLTHLLNTSHNNSQSFVLNLLANLMSAESNRENEVSDHGCTASTGDRVVRNIQDIQIQMLMEFLEVREAEYWDTNKTEEVISWILEEGNCFNEFTEDSIRQCLRKYLSGKREGELEDHGSKGIGQLIVNDDVEGIYRVLHYDKLPAVTKLCTDDPFCSKELPSLLSQAIDQDAVKVVKWLHKTFERKDVFLTRNAEGLLPLHYAIRRGNVAVLKAILSVGEQCSGVRLPDRSGMYALHLASQRGSLDLVTALTSSLLAPGSGVGSSCLYQPSGDGRTAAMVAVEGRHWRVVRELVSLDLHEEARYAALRDAAGQNLMHYASFFSAMEILPAVAPASRPESARTSPATTSSQQCSPQATLEAGVKAGPNAMESLNEMRLEVIDMLLHSYSCDFAACRDNQGYLPLHIAAQQGDAKVVDMLSRQREAYFAPAAEGGSCLQAKNGRTPLHFACQCGSVESVRTLLELNRCFCVPKLMLDLVSTAGSDGRLPLHLAAFGGSVDVVDLLLERHPRSCWSCVGNNLTPLHVACSHGHYDVMLRLLAVSEEPVFMADTTTRVPSSAHGAVECEHSDNYPITHAIRNQHWKIVLFLLVKFPRLVSAITTPSTGISFFHLVAHNFHVLTDVGENTNQLRRLMVQKIWSLALEHIGWDPSVLPVSMRTLRPTPPGSTEVACLSEICVDEKSPLALRPDALGYTPLHMACCIGDTKFVCFILDSYDGDEYGPTAKDTTKIGMISRSIIKFRAGNGRSAMHFAAQCKHEEVLTLLCGYISTAEEVTLRSEDGRLPLHLAVYHLDSMPMSPDIVARLGAGASIATQSGLLPLHLACMINVDWEPNDPTVSRVDAIDKKMLIAQQCARIYPRALVSYCGTDRYARLPLHIAIAHRCWTLVRWLFDTVEFNLGNFVHNLPAPFENMTSCTPTFPAIVSSEVLYPCTCDSNASAAQNLEPYDNLLCNFVNLEARNTIVHCLASVSPPLDISSLEAAQWRSLVEYVCSYRAHAVGVFTTNVDGHSVFHLACHFGNYIALEVLLEVYFRRCLPRNEPEHCPPTMGAEPNWRRGLEERYLTEDILSWETADHQTALHLAARRGCTRCVNLLLRYYELYRLKLGISSATGHLASMLTSSSGFQALHVAADVNHIGAIALLLSSANSGNAAVKGALSGSLTDGYSCWEELKNCRLVSSCLREALLRFSTSTSECLLHLLMPHFRADILYETSHNSCHTNDREGAYAEYIRIVIELYLKPCECDYTNRTVVTRAYARTLEYQRVAVFLSLLYCSQKELTFKRRQLVPFTADLPVVTAENDYVPSPIAHNAAGQCIYFSPIDNILSPPYADFVYGATGRLSTPAPMDFVDPLSRAKLVQLLTNKLRHINQYLKLNLEAPRLLLIRRILRLTGSYMADAESTVWAQALIDWFPEANRSDSSTTPLASFNDVQELCKVINWSYRRTILMVANRVTNPTNYPEMKLRREHLTRSDAALDYLLRVRKISVSCTDIWRCILCFL